MDGAKSASDSSSVVSELSEDYYDKDTKSDDEEDEDKKLENTTNPTLLATQLDNPSIKSETIKTFFIHGFARVIKIRNRSGSTVWVAVSSDPNQKLVVTSSKKGAVEFGTKIALSFDKSATREHAVTTHQIKRIHDKHYTDIYLPSDGCFVTLAVWLDKEKQFGIYERDRFIQKGHKFTIYLRHIIGNPPAAISLPQKRE